MICARSEPFRTDIFAQTKAFLLFPKNDSETQEKYSRLRGRALDTGTFGG